MTDRRGQRRPSPALLRNLACAAVSLLVMTLASVVSAPTVSAAVPKDFAEVTAFGGLVNPTAIRFAPDGRIFVAEKRGTVQMYEGLTDTTPTRVADLRTEVHNFWDRGLLGLAVDPQFPTRPFLYALYTFDGPVGGSAPRWGTAGADSDPCPTPPGATSDGCVVSAKLVKLTLDGTTTTKQDLIHDWCQQYPSHSIGDLAFGPDGALYATGGDGAHFGSVDYGQDGDPVNPCGDPPGGVGAVLSPPTAEGGALRSQDLRTPADPTTLDGTVIRVSPDTGAALPDNPNVSSADLNARRIVAYGLRNPFRMSFRPGTSEVWLGDVGWSAHEEINRLVSPTAGVTNFGWPCYEGDARQPGYDSADLRLCEDLYAQGNGDLKPYFTYRHGEPVSATDNCNVTTGSSSAGISFQFYSGGAYPAEYDGALFFADYSRKCIWVMTKGTDGLPDKLKARPFVSGAAGPVDLELSPQGEVFYVDFDGGTIRRIVHTGGACLPGQYRAEYFSNRTMSGTPTVTGCERAPLDRDWGGGGPVGVSSNNFSARWTGSFAFDGAPYTFTATVSDGMRVWVDGVQVIDEWRDGTTRTSSVTRSMTSGNHEVRVEYYEKTAEAVAKLSWSGGTATVNTPPEPVILSPMAGTTFTVGDRISFAGAATDTEDGDLPAANLSWRLLQQHCPADCHGHLVTTWPGVSSGSFEAPDHGYPSHLVLELTATDARGATATASRRLEPQTSTVTLTSEPPGLLLSLGDRTAAAPFTSTVIVGSTTSVSAVSPQVADGMTYAFDAWSDGGAQTHSVTAGSTPATYTARFTATGTGTGCQRNQYLAEYFANTTLAGAPAASGCEGSPLAHDWGEGSPAGVGPDTFSARWSGTFDFAADATYTFTAVADDGIRVWVDGTVLIDQWKDQAPTTYTASRALGAGAHVVTVEYYEAGGGAVAKLDWVDSTGARCGAGQYRAEYFANRTLSGAPVSIVCESAPLTRDWGAGGPSGVGANNFSARWTGTIPFAGGSTTFTASSDDGIRVWFDGVRIIDRWADGAGERTHTRNVLAGDHQVTVEYYEKSGSAFARVTW